MAKISDSLAKKIGEPGIIEKLTTLSLSELNSLLLDVFRKKAEQVSPAALLRNYEKNRFVSFSQYDPIDFKKFEITLLELAKDSGFIPLELSPVAPFGSCSAIATVDQNKIISAARGTEVVADATNLLALECSKRRRESAFQDIQQFCTAHKHIRGQSIPNKPGMTAHFKIFCAVTAGKDSGSFEFEKESLLSHLSFYEKYLKEQLKLKDFTVRLRAMPSADQNRLYNTVSDCIESKIKTVQFQRIETDPINQQYYQYLQFKIYFLLNGSEFEIGDGGFVDWSQKLTGNKKERMLISGIGIEYLYKILNKII